MEISNKEEDNSLKYAVIAVLLIAGFVLVREFFLKSQPLNLPEFKPPFYEINIKTEILESEEITNFSLFPKINLPESIGRENPFKPY